MVMVLFRMLRFLGATATLAPGAPWRHKRQVELPSALAPHRHQSGDFGATACACVHAVAKASLSMAYGL